MIRVQALSKEYGGHAALDAVSFVARPGRVTGFVGPNGAGKSTCLRVVAGLTRPTAGTATIDGRPLSEAASAGSLLGVFLTGSRSPTTSRRTRSSPTCAICSAYRWEGSPRCSRRSAFPPMAGSGSGPSRSG